jgi:hypothetical protein
MTDDDQDALLSQYKALRPKYKIGTLKLVEMLLEDLDEQHGDHGPVEHSVVTTLEAALEAYAEVVDAVHTGELTQSAASAEGSESPNV